MHGTRVRLIGLVAAALAAFGCDDVGGDTCSNGFFDGLETGMDCGGPCAGCPDGGHCTVDADCASGVCDRGFCLATAPTCDDLIENGDETAADCGGSCLPCGDGESCRVDGDCESARCEGDVCASCTDGRQSGEEIGVDCLGPCAAGCPDETPCTYPEDCLSGVCDETCQEAACDDGVPNGGESDEDCGAVCPDSPCPVGSACVVPEDCEASAACVDGTCQPVASCRELLELRPGAATGPYTIEPGVGASCSVVCDMTTDGGGWTLVASSSVEPLEDTTTACHGDLATDEPSRSTTGIWPGLRDLSGAAAEEGDLRFSCKRDVADLSFEVDVVFYGVDWYHEVTKGTDTHSCFNPETDGDGAALPSPPSVRRADLLSGEVRPAFIGWTDGVFHGEHACVDPDSFAVDLDGPGLSAPGALQLTSWGAVDGDRRCGSRPLEPGKGAWFLWFREAPAAP